MSKQPSAVDQATAVRIIALRKARGLSQTTVADALGVTFQQVQKYERGVNRISPGALSKLAALFEVPVSVLFDQEADNEINRNGFINLFEIDGANELMRAYVEIEDLEVRRKVLAIVRGLARVAARVAELKVPEITT